MNKFLISMVYTLGKYNRWVQLANILHGPEGLALALPERAPHVNKDKWGPDLNQI